MLKSKYLKYLSKNRNENINASLVEKTVVLAAGKYTSHQIGKKDPCKRLLEATPRHENLDLQKYEKTTNSRSREMAEN